jgi:hypothetical protein
MTIDENTNEMIQFFRKLADDIENNELSPEQMLKAGEIFMSYKFTKETKDDEMSEEEIKKFLFTGWYIYSKLPPGV